jgi:hypothetical protein
MIFDGPFQVARMVITHPYARHCVEKARFKLGI